ncbi:MAG: hypothetical protein WC333_02055 [Dehalococcoidia bacterium]|jgi:hypothetical protein
MEKKFVIYWDETYMTSKSRVVELSFFSALKGFDIEDQNAVERLDIGETTPMDNNHIWIMRVK